MTRTPLTALLLLLAALALYLLPGHYLAQWRLYLHDGSVTLRRRLGLGEPEPPPRAAVDEIPLRQRIEELTDAVMRRDAEIARLQSRLASLTEFHERFPRLNVVEARVILAGGGALGDTVTLDKGRVDGVTEGTAVLQGQNLLGRVVQLGDHSCLALLVSAPGSIVSARSGRTRERCTAHGSGRGSAYATFYGTKIRAEAGDMLYTSGLLGKLPAGLQIGMLRENPGEGPEPATQEATLELRANLAVLEDVLILRNAGEEDAPATPPVG